MNRCAARPSYENRCRIEVTPTSDRIKSPSRGRWGTRLLRGHAPSRPVPTILARAALLLTVSSLACTFEYSTGSSPVASATVRVKAASGWTDTRIALRAGDRFRIRYESGQWSPWPGGSYDAMGSGGDPRCACNVMLGVSHAALIGRIGDGPAFFVGGGLLAVAVEPGHLYLGINDTRLGDNSGWLDVRVEWPR